MKTIWFASSYRCAPMPPNKPFTYVQSHPSDSGILPWWPFDAVYSVVLSSRLIDHWSSIRDIDLKSNYNQMVKPSADDTLESQQPIYQTA